ncbi:MAG: DUF484 family protein [Burkholderiaceae bacterium]
MTTESLDPTDVARYLSEHPDFFQAFPDVLGNVTIPAAHGGRAISLHERQLEVLRERNRQQEARLVELIRIGQENDALADRLQKWTRQLLLERDVTRLPSVVADGLAGTFSVPQVALRLWGACDAHRLQPFAAPVDADIIRLAEGMRQPYCGPNAEFMAAAWLPGEGRETRSLALVPLRGSDDSQVFGLLVLGSADPDRFTAGMGTAFLERIGEIAGAALSRLAD